MVGQNGVLAVGVASRRWGAGEGGAGELLEPGWEDVCAEFYRIVTFILCARRNNWRIFKVHFFRVIF